MTSGLLDACQIPISVKQISVDRRRCKVYRHVPASAYVHFGVFRGRESNRDCADFVFTRRQSSKAVGAVCIRRGRFLCARRIRQGDARADNGRAELVGD